jgi:hypothetical protein
MRGYRNVLEKPFQRPWAGVGKAAYAVKCSSRRRRELGRSAAVKNVDSLLEHQAHCGEILSKPLTGIEPAFRRTALITTITTNPHFQLLQLEALFAILTDKEISSWPARLFISPDCQIATEK